MARVGKDGLKNKVQHLDTDSVPINQVDLADIIIDPLFTANLFICDLEA
jgi:hypothetical protein